MSLKVKYGSFSGTKMKVSFFAVFLHLTMSGYGFNIGTDVTLHFHHELSTQDSSCFYLASLEGASQPFFHQNQMTPRGLRSGQEGRLDVMVEQSQRDVTIHITIQALSQSDDGWYIVEVVEQTGGGLTPYVYREYLKVTYPPGKAQCRLSKPNRLYKWLLAHCNAIPGQNSSGDLTCLQNFGETPIYMPNENNGTHITAAFWIDPDTPSQCCSLSTSQSNLDSCNDFVYTPPPDKSLSSDQPDDITPNTELLGFNIGTDVILDFHHELSSQESSYFYLASIKGASEPFFHQNQINPRGLKPGQEGRVDVMVEQSQRELTIHITIQALNQSDEGWYIVEVVEETEGELTPYVYRDHINVTYPPGKAQCRISKPHRFDKWLLAHCNAILDHNSSGHLDCIQNFGETPIYMSTENNGTHITAVFWIDPTTRSQCCSHANIDFYRNTCNDFVYMPPPDESLLSDQPDDITPNIALSGTPKPDDTTSTNGRNILLLGIGVTMPMAFGIVIGACIIIFYNLWFRNKKSSPSKDTINQ